MTERRRAAWSLPASVQIASLIVSLLAIAGAFAGIVRHDAKLRHGMDLLGRQIEGVRGILCAHLENEHDRQCPKWIDGELATPSHLFLVAPSPAAPWAPRHDRRNGRAIARDRLQPGFLAESHYHVNALPD